MTIPAECVLGTLESVKVEGVLTQEQYPEDRDNGTICHQAVFNRPKQILGQPSREQSGRKRKRPWNGGKEMIKAHKKECMDGMHMKLPTI